MKSMRLVDARAKLSAVMRDAVAGQPTIITRRGREQAVVLSLEDYERGLKWAELREAAERRWQANTSKDESN